MCQRISCDEKRLVTTTIPAWVLFWPSRSNKSNPSKSHPFQICDPACLAGTIATPAICPGAAPVIPYAIWVSEIMLQQTRVAAVLGRYESFLRNFPTVAALAHAEESDVLTQWSGLGYYRRARMMHKAAKMVVQDYRGIMPKTAAGLRELPGIGRIHIRCDCQHRLRRASCRRGWQCRARRTKAGRHRFPSCAAAQSRIARQTEHLAGLLLDPRRAGDFNQSYDGTGRDCMPAAQSDVPCVPGEENVQDARRASYARPGQDAQ